MAKKFDFQCIYGECICMEGFEGDGIDCSASTQSNRIVIPIRKSPKMKGKQCVDEYWQEIAKLDKV